MEKINQNLTVNNNQIQSNQQTPYEKQKGIYTDYVNKITKSDFANSFTRYKIELNLLKDLRQEAEKQNLTGEIAFIEEKEKTVKEALAKLGFVIRKTD